MSMAIPVASGQYSRQKSQVKQVRSSEVRRGMVHCRYLLPSSPSFLEKNCFKWRPMLMVDSAIDSIDP